MSPKTDQVKIKVCGLTRQADAILAVDLGAWALGVIFAPESPRRIGIEQAAELLAATPSGIERVGVFVNAGVAEIEQAVDACGLTVVQLHGEEEPASCMEVARSTGCKVIKAVRVSDMESLETVVRFDTDYLLLDTYSPQRRGGTGEAFDWSLTGKLPASERRTRVILSGGLNPENVEAAIAAVGPFAVDVSSGIESAPGIKDEDRMRHFFLNIRKTSREEDNQ